MNPLVRRRLSYLTFHLFMFLSGVEYAVIFPTIWENLQSLGVPPDQTYWLGMTVSAMTVTDMVSGLLIGRIMDLKCNPKLIVLILNCCQIAGSCLYLTASSPAWLIVSRLVSGLGKGITIVFLTDICRTTDVGERTPILLLFNIAFQVGLLLGPACNLALSYLDMDTMMGHLDKLNSPGLLLALSWAIFSLLVLLFYRDLATLKERIRIRGEMANAYNRTVHATEYQVLSTGHDNRECDLLIYHDELDDSEHEQQDITDAEQNQDRDEPEAVKAPLYTEVEATYPCSLPVPSNISPSDISHFRGGSTTRLQVKLEDIQQVDFSRNSKNYGSFRSSSPRQRSDSRASRKSNIFIDAAEHLMGESTTSVSSDSSGRGSYDDTPIENNDELVLDRTEVCSWRDYMQLIVREEIICLVYLRFIALFCQTCLESSVPPIMQKYFDYGDQANSILYLLAGLELIVIFIMLSIASKRVNDRVLISAGLLVMMIALSWLLATLPRFSPSTRSNLPYFAVGVVLDLAGIPTVCDIGLALYSKLLPDNMQGLGHAVRRFISQLAIILGPLWGASTLTNPTMMIVTPLTLLILACVMFTLSYKRMVPIQDNSHSQDTHQ